MIMFIPGIYAVWLISKSLILCFSLSQLQKKKLDLISLIYITFCVDGNPREGHILYIFFNLSSYEDHWKPNISWEIFSLSTYSIMTNAMKKCLSKMYVSCSKDNSYRYISGSLTSLEVKYPSSQPKLHNNWRHLTWSIKMERIIVDQSK